MSQTHQEVPPTPVELSADLLNRIDGLVQRMQHSPLSRQIRITRDLLVRMALLHGIEELERSCPPQ